METDQSKISNHGFVSGKGVRNVRSKTTHRRSHTAPLLVAVSEAGSWLDAPMYDATRNE